MREEKLWYRMVLIYVGYLCLVATICNADSIGSGTSSDNVQGQRFKLEGKVTVPGATEEWKSDIRILVDGGRFLGLLKQDGSFSISVPSGSYIIEATHPTYLFDPARVEVNSKGKIRARVVNNIQPSAVTSIAYPLRFKSRGNAPYFQKREQWRLTDFLFNPMIMMMFFPLALMFLLPKLMNNSDPETQREMQQSMNFLQPQQNFPDAAEMLTKLFGGGGSSTSSSSGSITDGGRKSGGKSRTKRQ